MARIAWRLALRLDGHPTSVLGLRHHPLLQICDHWSR